MHNNKKIIKSFKSISNIFIKIYEEKFSKTKNKKINKGLHKKG